MTKEEVEQGKMIGRIAIEEINRRFNTKPIGGRIPVDCHDWDEYGLICDRYHISKSYAGFLDMVQTSNRINMVLFPLADKYHCDPLRFKNDVLDAMLSLFSVMEQNGMADMIQKVIMSYNKSVSSVDETFKGEIINTLKQNVEKTLKIKV